MDKDVIEKRKEMIEHALGCKLQVIERQTGDQLPQNYLPLGTDLGRQWGVVIETELSNRERILLHQLVSLWRDQDRERLSVPFEELLATWMIDNLEQTTPASMPEKLRSQLDWGQQWLPLGFTLSGASSSAQLQALKELLASYLPPQTLYLRLTPSFLFCLVSIAGLESEYLEGDLSAWISGLNDFCQNEFSMPVQIHYHANISSADELLERVRDLIMNQQISAWSMPIHEPTAPWHRLLEQLVHQLPDQERQRLLSIYQRIGSLALFKQQEWVNTLMVFFRSNLNISLASKELYIHRNTLIYRLDRIAEETGFDPRSFKDAVSLQMVLLLLQKEEFGQLD